MKSDESTIPLPEPGMLRVGPPPYWHGLPGVVPITMTFLAAVALVVLVGVVLFGWHALRVLAISVAVALLVESTFDLLTRRSRSWSESHALLTGVLFACTLPPTVRWHVPVLGSVLAVLLGHALLGGVGNYLWHPAALARIVVQVFFHQDLTPARWPVLAPGRLIWGNLTGARPLPPLRTWGLPLVPDGVQALAVVRPVDHLRSPLATETGATPR